MNENFSGAGLPVDAPEAEIRKKSPFSIVWVVPLIAMLIGGWLVFKGLTEKGPTVTIAFKSAEGLEAGKTKIRYKDVEVGLVESIVLDEDLSRVLVTAELNKELKPYLTRKTRFWVVRARVSASEISGLGTLLGGAYIAIDPVKEGEPDRTFKGLEAPPVVTMDLPGRHYVLRADRLGSLSAGSPIYYRQIEVGQVESYEMDKEGRYVEIRIFVNDPYHQFIRQNTRFWNAGGFDLSVDANGLTVDSQSLATILMGGIAFDSPMALDSDELAENNHIFSLFDSRQTAMSQQYQAKRYWMVEFGGSVRGLTVGAPVEFRGLQVGRVLDIVCRVGKETGSDIVIAVLVEAEPERLLGKELIDNETEYRKFIDSLVAKGFRAQLKTGNILTGKLFVDLEFHPDAPPDAMRWDGEYPRLPSIPKSLDELLAVLKQLLAGIEKVPFTEIGQDLRAVVKNLSETIEVLEELTRRVNTEVAPEAAAMLRQTTKTLVEIQTSFGEDSTFNQNARQTLEELTNTAQALRMLADYLERHPEALIYGKGETK
ncbi:MAG: MlaD family protein [Thermodesulfobacteriota bacterium]